MALEMGPFIPATCVQTYWYRRVENAFRTRLPTVRSLQA